MVGKIYNFFAHYSRLGFHIVILYLVLLFVPSISFADITVRVANLKQDMELVTRELAGLRTEVELLRRENAQLKVQLEHSTRKQSSNAGVSSEVLQAMNERMKKLEFKLLQSEKSQLSLQKSVDLKMTELITQMNKGFDQVQSSPAKPALVPTFNQDYPQTGFVHSVEKGETISSIAQKYKSKTKWIINANQIIDPKKVFIGKELFIPQ